MWERRTAAVPVGETNWTNVRVVRLMSSVPPARTVMFPPW